MKKLISIFAAFFLLVSLCVPASAAAQLDNVTDEEWLALDEQAETVSQTYKCGVYIVILEDYTAYVDTDSVYEAAKTIYQEYDLGVGTEKSGVMLLLSMAERDYTLIGYGNTAFTDYGKEVLAEEFLDDFGDDDWYGGFADYLEESAEMLKLARDGKPVDRGQNPLVNLLGVILGLAIGIGVAFLICFYLRNSMKSVAQGTEADQYIDADSLDIRIREDQFTHRT